MHCRVVLSRHQDRLAWALRRQLEVVVLHLDKSVSGLHTRLFGLTPWIELGDDHALLALRCKVGPTREADFRRVQTAD